jgi:hypothetical protein
MADAEDRKPLDRVAEAAGAARRRGPAPVHLWTPAHSGEIDIVIRADGSWVHEGGVIGREALVQLFSTILRKDPDGIYLVTPGEKLRITVEDAPFVAVAVEAGPEGLTFTTNVGDRVTADAEHPIRVQTSADGTPRPYVEVRRGLEALIARPVFYELVELAETRDGAPGLSSGGAWFPIGPAA